MSNSKPNSNSTQWINHGLLVSSPNADGIVYKIKYNHVITIETPSINRNKLEDKIHNLEQILESLKKADGSHSKL